MLSFVDLKLSSSMQMYLVEIKRLGNQFEPVPLSVLADSLQISPVSANEMCRKLDEMELLRYQPYKGASLTERGDQEALQILRRHRLWEVFLVEKLHFDFQTAHRMADDLEHATPANLADRLQEFLGCPQFNPEGKEIPSFGEESQTIRTVLLTEIEVGSTALLWDEGLAQDVLGFLKGAGIRSGETLTVLGKSANQILIRGAKGMIHLSREIAETIKTMVPEPSQTEETLAGKKSFQPEESERIMEEKTIKKLNLKNLKVGQRGVVVKVKGSGATKQRMMDMGLVPGCEVKVVRVAPLGDPIEINLKGYHLSLRKNEAQNIEIEAFEGDE